MSGYWGDFDKPETERVDLAFDSVVHRTASAVLFDFGDSEVWIPLSQIRYVDTDINVAEVSEWIAKEKGLI